MIQLSIIGVILYFLFKKVKSWGEDAAYMNSIEKTYEKEKDLGERVFERSAGNFSIHNK